MPVRVHRYTLMPRRRLRGIAREGSREGALLRIDGGFADLHPWPELGDAPLEEQLALLAVGRTTPLTRAAIRLARLDADARRRGVSLFEGLQIPKSHWPGSDPPPGFDTIKIKGMMDVPPHIRVRIDFNATLTASEFLQYAERLPRDRVDFIEDPCAYEPAIWTQLGHQTGLRLALDARRSNSGLVKDSFDVLVHKPARDEWLDHPAVVVTTYMDHTVGQFFAAWVAASHPVDARCGLFTHVLYEPDAFIERIAADGARLLPPAGTGIGFDDLLENLPWKKLA